MTSARKANGDEIANGIFLTFSQGIKISTLGITVSGNGPYQVSDIK